MKQKTTLILGGVIMTAAGVTAAREELLPKKNPAGPWETPVIHCQQAPVTSTSETNLTRADVTCRKQPMIEVVFALDTTGSMGGLIEGAKQKIWSIANQLASATPAPQIRMGLVAYRDRHDQYITRVFQLTDDLDQMYGDLMGFVADGGGDGPESVNQALHDAVSQIEWSSDADTLRVLYLVGDAPPHMDYEDDVKYDVTCKLAMEKDIVIHTIQCGGDPTTTTVWQEIAKKGEGNYFAIGQNGGVQAVATPFDEDLAKLAVELRSTTVHYGDQEQLEKSRLKNDLALSIEAEATSEVLADRAGLLALGAGRRSLLGAQELVDDVARGHVKLEELDAEDLPGELKKMTLDERKAFIAEKARQRAEVEKAIQGLNEQRSRYLKEHAGGNDEAFDIKVLDSLKSQAAKKGMKFEDREPSKGATDK